MQLTLSSFGATYDVDPAGNDAKDGVSAATPWQSLGKVNGTTFLPGDNVLFKRGGTWSGSLHPLGSGNTVTTVYGQEINFAGEAEYHAWTGYQALFVGVADGSSRFDGVIADAETAGSLVKEGAGTLTLAGANTYSGTTTVSGGALLVNGSLGVGKVNVSDGATLGGSGTVPGAVSLASGAKLAPGAADGSIGTLTLGSVSSLAGVTLLADTAVGGACDRLAVTGPVDLSGLTVQVASPSQLSQSRQYTFATTEGRFVGLPDLAGLKTWRLEVRNGDTLLLKAKLGTLIQVQ